MGAIYWITALVAVAFALALILLAIDLLTQEVQIRREARELQRRKAYLPRHYLNEDEDTQTLPIGVVS